MIDDHTHDADFLFTWKPEKWPYAKLKTLIDDFESGKSVTENWRCRAVRKIRPRSKGYLLKQGKPRGIFGIATITGFPRKRPDAKPDESQFEVPLTFNALVDPTKRFLIHEEQLLEFRCLATAGNRWPAACPLNQKPHGSSIK